MPIEVLGQLPEMPTAKKRGRKGEVVRLFTETLKPNPNKIFNVRANSSVSNTLRKDYGVEARSYTSDVPEKDKNGRPKLDKNGKQVYETYVAAVWRGEARAAEIQKEYAEKAAAKKAKAESQTT